MKSSPYMDGWFAHKKDLGTVNPYDEKTQSYSHNQWTSGWCDRFSAIKHRLDLSLDDEEFN